MPFNTSTSGSPDVPPGVSSDATDESDAGGYRKTTLSNSISPRGSTKSIAPGRSTMDTGASNTSNTRSNETNAVMTSTRALVRPVRG